MTNIMSKQFKASNEEGAAQALPEQPPEENEKTAAAVRGANNNWPLRSRY